MNDDYLWDRSQPDPEIEQLEEILGELRYQPRPLEIPAQSSGANRFFSARYAIAAALAMVVLGFGVWMAWERQRASEVPSAKQQKSYSDDSQRAAASPIDEKKLSMSANNHGIEIKSDSPALSRGGATSKGRRSRRPSIVSEMTAAERAQAKKAKDDLMQVFRLASSKLNYAQKKMQGEGSTEVHNQHKIG